jgi:hypothetical protein
MQRLLEAVEGLRAKLPDLRGHNLNEAGTRAVVIDPILGALGWDVRDPSKVHLEYPTVDGKSVDYALEVEGNPAILVKAKALGDSLSDVKAVTQVVAYAANAGIPWCILTNGVKWQVYSSLEQCAAPEKLMFQVALDSEASNIESLAKSLWRVSTQELTQGSLTAFREQTFTDSDVRKALDAIRRDPPTRFLNLVRKTIGDEEMSIRKVRESVIRVWAAAPPPPPPPPPPPNREEEMLRDKPEGIVAVYRALESHCLAIKPEKMAIRVRKGYFACSCGTRRTVFRGAVKKHWVRVHLEHFPYDETQHQFPFQSPHKKWKYLVLRIRDLQQFEQAKPLITKAFESGP